MNAKDLLQGNVAAWNRRDRAGYVATYAEDCALTSPDGGGKGQEAVGAFYWDQIAMLGQLGLLPPT